MKKALTITIVILVLLAIVAIFFVFNKSSSVSEQPGGFQNQYYPGDSSNTVGVNVTPGSTATSSTFLVTPLTGSLIRVNDFRLSPNTATSSTIAGHYFISGGLDPAGTDAAYSTFYVEKDQSFNITLLKEPLAQTRQDAEDELRTVLGIKQLDMCRLRYAVVVPKELNSIYSNKNLGFSFCPGATKL